ncbi:class I SAM-dependent methyltransferase [Methanogenium marinum]|uniref:Class I SAM-dependent methyltransferase n=1 Tax=Methanogenium marinum TaxID=348610 RepID=A0A9Q4KTR3_9EURY|nr:class I SAM-dependent methyltransferase [Methanogenium marinum]MDE4908569.1 class I SAM-dependent methyltransferase [Methanogenium marinum]
MHSLWGMMVPEIELGDVAATSLITLYCHAIETRSEDPILYDPKSVEISTVLDPILSRSKSPLERTLAKGMVDPKLVVHIAIRARKYDQYVLDFLVKYPDGVVVNIGCGLDSRFLRIDNGLVDFYDLDLPEVISLKKRFFTETKRYHLIASSVLDDAWMSVVSAHAGPFLFLAEGVFMYLEGEAVKSLVLRLREHFSGSELVCEVVNSIWITKPLNTLAEYKMRRRLHIGKDAVFRSGIRRSEEMEEWHPGIRLLDEWSYFDSDEKKLGWLKIFSQISLFRYTQWTVHYLLG